MKAKLKNGETIRISDLSRIILERCDSYGNPIEVDWNEISQIVDENGIPLGFPNPFSGGIIMTNNVDWEQRRYEIAKKMLTVTSNFTELSCNGVSKRRIGRKDAVQIAVRYADTLIEELKKEKK